MTDSSNKKGYQSTIIFSTGGFLKKRTTVEVNVPYAEMSQGVLDTPIWMGDITQKIEVGGAVIIVVDACYYEKI